MTTNLDLDAIRTREDNATKGPWTVGPRKLISAEVYERTIYSPSTDEARPKQPDELAVIRYWAGAFQYPHADAYADAEFIAHAREDIPALLGLIENLRDKIDRLEKAQEQDAIVIASMRAAIDEADAEAEAE